MTIEELYLWAEANGYENYDIETLRLWTMTENIVS